VKAVELKKIKAAENPTDTEEFILTIPQPNGQQKDFFFIKDLIESTDKRHLKWTDQIAILKGLDIVVRETEDLSLGGSSSTNPGDGGGGSSGGGGTGTALVPPVKKTLLIESGRELLLPSNLDASKTVLVYLNGILQEDGAYTIASGKLRVDYEFETQDHITLVYYKI
jgi:hypothetical protein